jgi:predicted CXXCH cytochrome family protein
MKSAFIACTLAFLLAGANCQAAESKGTIDPVSGKPCYQCHRSKVTGVYIHDALAGNECTPCHGTTGGNHQKDHALYAVKDKSANLCWQCHESQANAKSLHPIISAEGCLACHGPHNSSQKQLLRAVPPKLCFQCHERSMVEEKVTQKATGFRDGTENLHFVHAGKNGIACLTCHDVHASTQLHLIRPKGTNGKDQVTITYTGAEKGGNCAASCHDPLSYERK